MVKATVSTTIETFTLLMGCFLGNRKYLVRLSFFRININVRTLLAVTYYFLFLKGRCLLIPKYFGADYDYAGKADLTKDYWNPKRKLGGNHAFFRDN